MSKILLGMVTDANGITHKVYSIGTVFKVGQSTSSYKKYSIRSLDGMTLEYKYPSDQNWSKFHGIHESPLEAQLKYLWLIKPFEEVILGSKDNR